MNEKPPLSEAEQGALMRRTLDLAKDAGNIPPEPAEDSEWATWIDTADQPTRMAHPQHYWHVQPEGASRAHQPSEKIHRLPITQHSKPREWCRNMPCGGRSTRLTPLKRLRFSCSSCATPGTTPGFLFPRPTFSGENQSDEIAFNQHWPRPSTADRSQPGHQRCRPSAGH
jgi:hypothetical protein